MKPDVQGEHAYSIFRDVSDIVRTHIEAILKELSDEDRKNFVDSYALSVGNTLGRQAERYAKYTMGTMIKYPHLHGEKPLGRNSPAPEFVPPCKWVRYSNFDMTGCDATHGAVNPNAPRDQMWHNVLIDMKGISLFGRAVQYGKFMAGTLFYDNCVWTDARGPYGSVVYAYAANPKTPLDEFVFEYEPE